MVDQEIIKEVRGQIIEELMAKSIRLSYSALKNFTSPINLVNYLVDKRLVKLGHKIDVKSAAMLEGIASDTYLLEPDKYKTDIVVVESMPSTDKQKEFIASVLSKVSDKSPLSVELAVEHGGYTRSADAVKAFKKFERYISALSLKKTIIDTEMDQRVKSLTDALKSHNDVEEMMSRISAVQKKIEWEDNGWQFIAFLDMELEEEDITDVKRTKDADPDSFERDIRYNKYYLQAGMYCYGYYLNYDKLPNYSLLAYDTTYNYDIFHLDFSYINYGISEYRYKIEQLDRAIAENAFWKSYGFFKPERRIYKPKWIQGFELQTPVPSLYKKQYQEPND